MRIYRAKDYDDMSRKAANIISAQVILKPDCVLGLATGSTPIGAYKQLVEWYNKGGSGLFRSNHCQSGRIQGASEGQRPELLLFYAGKPF